MFKFHGEKKKRSYFEGWYFKQQGKNGTLAMIPAYHADKKGKRFATLQAVTDKETELIEYPAEEFRVFENPFSLYLGNSRFSESGCSLDFRGKHLEIKGELHYGPLAPPDYDVMGPFNAVPFLPCRHSVFSLSHRVDGCLHVNGTPFVFQNSFGYMEGDRGRSFPNQYLWTQCSGRNFSIMLSVAEIPILTKQMPGCIGIIFYKGKEYRLATYLGARVIYVDQDYAAVEQNGFLLEVRYLGKSSSGQPLYAPKAGNMDRIIIESPSCPVEYRLSKSGDPLFSLVSQKAGFESTWDGACEEKEAE
ncbi:hypothetical protein [Qiania dongpingensis]|uniref:Tocopherol cyclase n=1 Tax=Qiania dongpingensis TaxID=2763669 RepID=A0A7G9G0H9_9FIRM|nr:hypothetical protein [Qiania dongpingensis]QNM04311.1 hypothetical protein H9Q78_07345 [Qiania dongpingensis]